MSYTLKSGQSNVENNIFGLRIRAPFQGRGRNPRLAEAIETTSKEANTI
jgi:hypothetical protein